MDYRPSAVGGEAVGGVHRLKARLGEFSKLLETDAKGAVSHWSLELADVFREALTTIFEEVELLLKQA